MHQDPSGTTEEDLLKTYEVRPEGLYYLLHLLSSPSTIFLIYCLLRWRDVRYTFLIGRTYGMCFYRQEAWWYVLCIGRTWGTCSWIGRTCSTCGTGRDRGGPVCTCVVYLAGHAERVSR